VSSFDTPHFRVAADKLEGMKQRGARKKAPRERMREGTGLI